MKNKIFLDFLIRNAETKVNTKTNLQLHYNIFGEFAGKRIISMIETELFSHLGSIYF